MRRQESVVRLDRGGRLVGGPGGGGRISASCVAEGSLGHKQESAFRTAHLFER